MTKSIAVAAAASSLSVGMTPEKLLRDLHIVHLSHIVEDILIDAVMLSSAVIPVSAASATHSTQTTRKWRMRLSSFLPNVSRGNAFFALAILTFILGNVEPAFNPAPSVPQPPGQLGSYPGTLGNIGFIFHFFGGVGYIATGLFQFISPIRRMFPKFHRLTGYFFYAFQLVTLIGNLIFLFGRTSYLKGGVASFIASTFIFNPWWVFCSIKSLVAILRGDILKHRIFIIRSVAVSTGNFLVPPIDSLIRIVDPSVDPKLSYAAGFWFGFTLGVVIGEICIHFVYPSPKVTVAPAMLPLTSGIDVELSSWTELTVILKEQSGNYFRLILEAPFNLFIPPAYHISIQHPQKLKTFRPYTPVSANGRTVEFLIKKYENGVMSSYLAGLNVSDRVKCCGPFGSYEIQEHPQILMIAAGTGITPMLSILKHALEVLSLSTKFRLVHYNKEMILENHIASLKQNFGDQFTYDIVKDADAFDLNSVLLNHSFAANKLRTYTGGSATVLVCGPRLFNDDMFEKAVSCGIPQVEVFAFGYSDR
jgi:NAD(P)H-flavin reductase